MNSDIEITRDDFVVNQSLATADAIARAAHLWIRSLCLNELYEDNERLALAGGLVAGLCERLELDSRVQELVTYVYALLDDEGGQALTVSRTMLDQSVSAFDYSAYEKGRSEAAGIVEMLGYHGETRVVS
jgi:hypothetical protein